MLGRRVDVNRQDSYSSIEELVVSLGDADQLRVAIWSPIAPQEEQQHAGVKVVRERHIQIGLISKGEVWYGHDQHRTDRAQTSVHSTLST